MPINPPSEDIEELREILRTLAPSAINIIQAFIDRDPNRIADEFIEMTLLADKAGLLD